jgi:hypothetical protein
MYVVTALESSSYRGRDRRITNGRFSCDTITMLARGVSPGPGFFAGGMRVFKHLYARRLQRHSRSFWASLREAREYPQTCVCGRVRRGLQTCKHQPTKLVGIDLQAFFS